MSPTPSSEDCVNTVTVVALNSEIGQHIVTWCSKPWTTHSQSPVQLEYPIAEILAPKYLGFLDILEYCRIPQRWDPSLVTCVTYTHNLKIIFFNFLLHLPFLGCLMRWDCGIFLPWHHVNNLKGSDLGRVLDVLRMLTCTKESKFSDCCTDASGGSLCEKY